MTTVHVGLPTHQGSVARLAQFFDLLEVRPVDTPLPKAPKLRQWRKEVPPAFVFSVIVPNALAELKTLSEAETAALLKPLIDAASALEARCMVLTTPVSVTPTALHKKRLAALIERLPRDVITLAWEPRGVWQSEEAAAWARDLGVQLVVDASQEEPGKGAVLYTRLRGIGVNARLGPGSIEKVRRAMAGRREVFVVVETAGPKQISAALKQPLGEGTRAVSPGVVRPQVRLSAEDEEQ
jgi:uncharacterized protein YecE (DUF72 family)